MAVKQREDKVKENYMSIANKEAKQRNFTMETSAQIIYKNSTYSIQMTLY